MSCNIRTASRSTKLLPGLRLMVDHAIDEGAWLRCGESSRARAPGTSCRCAAAAPAWRASTGAAP